MRAPPLLRWSNRAICAVHINFLLRQTAEEKCMKLTSMIRLCSNTCCIFVDQKKHFFPSKTFKLGPSPFGESAFRKNCTKIDARLKSISIQWGWDSWDGSKFRNSLETARRYKSRIILGYQIILIPNAILDKNNSKCSRFLGETDRKKFYGNIEGPEVLKIDQKV